MDHVIVNVHTVLFIYHYDQFGYFFWLGGRNDHYFGPNFAFCNNTQYIFI